MKIRELHPWDVSIKEAERIQEELKVQIIIDEITMDRIRRISAVDVAYLDDKAKVAVCIFDFLNLNLLEKITLTKNVKFPYIPGLLSFREGPLILEAFGRIRLKPDLVLFDGQGIMHPKRMGIATHLGIILDTPTIGCAKNHFYGEFRLPKEKRGDYSLVYDKKTKETLGAILRTKDNVKPVFVSPGFKISLVTSIEIILKTIKSYRIPEPLRFVHHLTRDYQK